MNDFDDFIPEGGARFSLAIWFLAKQRDGELWKELAFDEAEMQFWHDVIHDCGDSVSHVVRQEEQGGVQIATHVLARLNSYLAAEIDLRKNLHANKLKGYFISKSREQRGDLLHVQSKYWGMDDGLEVIRFGWCDRLADEPERRNVFLDKAEFHAVFFPDGFDAVLASKEVSTKGMPDKHSSAGAAIYRTGGQGKPSSMFLIIPEAKRRAEVDDVPQSKKLFTEELSAWLTGAHPTAPPASAKAIGNNATVSEVHRAVLLKRLTLSTGTSSAG